MKLLWGKQKKFLDVFTGDGWKNWSRFYYRNGRLIHKDGHKLAVHQLKEVYNAITNP